MIKAKTNKTIILGLSDANIEKLKNDQPIMFNLKEAGLADVDMDVLIFNGKTEESMMESLSELIGPNTEISKS